MDAGRGKGGHVYVRYGGRKSVVKMHGSKDLDNSYVKLVCGQLGIDSEDLQERPTCSLAIRSIFSCPKVRSSRG